MENNFSTLFRREYHEYKRDFDFVKQWAEQSVTYATIQDRNLDVEDFKQFIRDNIKPNGLFPPVNPRMSMIIKDQNNDRQLRQTTMMDYLKTIVKHDLKFAPTFTTYLNENQLRSVEASFLNVGMDKRNEEKKYKFIAKERGDDYMVEYHDRMQSMLKILNNSSSGAKGLAATILYNQTGHSTLTSICRSTTSFSNAINEKMLGGFRHYYSPEIIINNILAVLTYVDLQEVQNTMDNYHLHYVTPDELLWAIKRSSDLYWRSETAFQPIRDLVYKLTPLECSAYLYNGDIYMLREFNDTLIRDLFTRLINIEALTPVTVEEADNYLSIMDSDLASLIPVYTPHLCAGKSVKTACKEKPEIKPIIGAVIKNTIEVFEQHREIIKTFFVTDIAPHETSRVPDMMRGSVVGSDTDSSLTALDHNWVCWYFDRNIHGDKSRAVVATCVYIVSQHVAHVLGMMTGILNIIEEKRHLIAMKNEFLFSSFTTTSRGKHYYAKKEAQEGIMISKDKVEAEIKGVALQHTKVPRFITKQFHDVLHEVMATIENDEKIKILDLRRRVAELEYNVYKSICAGESTFLQRGQVKVNDAYKTANNLYKRGYEMWEDVFADKYGHTVEPPYDCIKIATGLNTNQKFNTWLDTLEDKDLVARFRKWVVEKNDNKPLKTFYLPQEVVNTRGLPTELMSVIDPRKLAATITAPYYLLQESFNIYEYNKSVTRLCSDDFEEWAIPDSLFSIEDDDTDDD